jgi:hypothetical protein
LTTGSSPAASQSSTKLLPMKPAPPVTRIMLLPLSHGAAGLDAMRNLLRWHEIRHYFMLALPRKGYSAG